MRVVSRLTPMGVLLLLLASVSTAQAEDYYIYRDSSGGLVLSNQKPPSNSTIINQLTLPDQFPDQSPSIQPRVQVVPETEPNIPADLAPRLNWVWAWSI